MREKATDLLLSRAARALGGFYLEDDGLFLRSTTSPPGDQSELHSFPPETGGTSTNRAFEATVQLLYYLIEERLYDPDTPANDQPSDVHRWPEIGDRLGRIVAAMCGIDDCYYRKEIHRLRKHSSNGPNAFTDAHLLVALSLSEGPFVRETLGLAEAGRAVELRALALERQEALTSSRLLTLDPDDPEGLHPLVVLYLVRGIEVALHTSGGPSHDGRVDTATEDALRRFARHSVLHQLGLSAAEDPDFDPGALLGGVAILQRFETVTGRQLILCGVKLLGDVQAADGSWNASVLVGNNRLVFLPSLEIAVGLVKVALADLANDTHELASTISPIIDRSRAFLETTYREGISAAHEPAAGWVNDQIGAAGTFESWSTALGAELLIGAERLRRRLKQLEVFDRYNVGRRPRPGVDWLRWIDLAGPVPLVRSQEAEVERAEAAMARASDPSAGRAVTQSLSELVIAPVLASPFDRPGTVASFMLYGPPGTRKSSMVRAVATALDWPLLTLSPPDFMKNGGIHGLDATAEQVFKDLFALRRVVVFFDECEEMFRRRLNDAGHRQPADFITSGMLPRLQELRDQAWVVFVIATNTELDELDPAVVRNGRLDARHRVGLPDVTAQKEYITGKAAHLGFDPTVTVACLVRYDDDHASDWRRAIYDEQDAAETYRDKGNIDKYLKRVHRLQAKEAAMAMVSFTVLDRLAAEVASSPGHADDEMWILDRLSAIATAARRPPDITDLAGMSLH